MRAESGSAYGKTLLQTLFLGVGVPHFYSTYEFVPRASINGRRKISATAATTVGAGSGCTDVSGFHCWCARP